MTPKLDSSATRRASRNELGTSGALSQPDAVLASQLRRTVPANDTVIVRYPSGRRVVAGDELRHPLVARVDGPQGSAVTLESPVDDVDARVQRALFAIVAVAIVALGAALALSLLQSARLAGPLSRLSRSASRLGEGDFSHATPRSGVQEIDEIADALDRSASSINGLLQAERRFSSHASHQLRSALTGLQLRLEELAANPDPVVRAEADAALGQSARLDATIDELLALARTGRAGVVTKFDLAQLAREHSEDIAPLLGRAGREIVVDAHRPVFVVATVGAFGQVLDILLSNTLRHGRGIVTLRVYCDGPHARLEVGDEGPGIASDDVETLFDRRQDSDGHGIGLALARTLVATEGGTLALVPRVPRSVPGRRSARLTET